MPNFIVKTAPGEFVRVTSFYGNGDRHTVSYLGCGQGAFIDGGATSVKADPVSREEYYAGRALDDAIKFAAGPSPKSVEEALAELDAVRGQ